MSIWFQKISIIDLTGIFANTMAEFLKMEWVEIGDDFLKLSMPVDNSTRQPYGFLHGGASCALAETIGSVVFSATSTVSKATQLLFVLVMLKI